MCPDSRARKSHESAGSTAAPIPESEWVWCGWAGHFIAASSCLLRMNTRVGNYRISTVGAYVSRDGNEYDTVGYNRWAETFVFRVEGEGIHGEGEVTEWGEIDSEGYPKSALENGDVERGHMEMCRKYARIAAGLEAEPSWA